MIGRTFFFYVTHIFNPDSIKNKKPFTKKLKNKKQKRIILANTSTIRQKDNIFFFLFESILDVHVAGRSTDVSNKNDFNIFVMELKLNS